MIIKNDYPILEYSTQQRAVINPKEYPEARFPRLCLMAFFEEVLAEAAEKYQGERIGAYLSEMKDFPVYRLRYNGVEVCMVQAAVASGSAAMMADYLYGRGVEVIICCGSCGVLDDIPAGNVIVPIRALRDEGASYHYLPPSRFVELPAAPVEAFCRVLKKYGIPYIQCAAWSTDGFYRETLEMAAYRRQEGCRVVEMECAALAAVAQFRQKLFGQLLYSGDILTDGGYDDREWWNNRPAREKLFYLALEALCLL